MSDPLVLDTDIASYLFKRSPHAQPFRTLLQGRPLALSFMSVAELYKWTVKRNWGSAKVRQLENAMKRYVVIPFDNDLAWTWARITAACENDGRPMSTADAWVAATAVRHSLELVSNNLPHFEAAEQLCGLRLVRPGA